MIIPIKILKNVEYNLSVRKKKKKRKSRWKDNSELTILFYVAKRKTLEEENGVKESRTALIKMHVDDCKNPQSFNYCANPPLFDHT